MGGDSEHLARTEAILRNARTFEAAYKVMAKIAVALGISTLALAASTAYLAMSRPEPRYFATSTDGQILPLVPLDRPHQTAAEVSNFAVRAVTTSLTYDFANYRSDFNNALQFFTKPAGWNQFVDAVQESQMLDLVQRRRLNTTAVANNAVIVREGVNSRGVYEWIVQIPLRVTYQSASEVTGQNFLITVNIERLQTYESPYAMAISRFIAAPGGA
ncbi:type IVB secretion system apparatus protein IcmL/DotI [Litoreibacter roseus]|uniref:Type IV secretion system protein IcmL n=1 Tax=Litoreibacter roseus TaxID=2601869 RepID=A0A6N6JM71_9RHOB|nr:type IVB secretion system apparatus protein IcmL/DotI [Litoreibacter roseus]GFE66970.1 type IV secretion system protein IcmL [Litoreibacter roseus]